MATVFESLGWFKPAPSTKLPQLGINNKLYSLQIDSAQYFTIGEGAVAADNNVLGVKPIKPFDLNSKEQIEYLENAVSLFNERFEQLKEIDLKINASVAIAVATTSILTFFPFASVLSIIGWGASIYYMKQRATAYVEYQESLKLLVGTCNWCLGKLEKEHVKEEHLNEYSEQLSNNDAIRNMMTSLYPVLTKDQVGHLIDDRIEGKFKAEFDEYEKKFQRGYEPQDQSKRKDDSIALSKKSAELIRCIYGFHKGGAIDFLDAIASALPDLYRKMRHGAQRFIFWAQEKMAPKSEPEHQPESPSPK